MGCLGSGKKLYFCSGELAEWSIAAVLKTVDLHGSGGSNPSLSANKKAMQKSIAFFRPRKPRPLAVERQKRAKKERHCGAMAFCLQGRPRQRKGYQIPHIPLNACVQEDEAYNKSDIAEQWRFFARPPAAAKGYLIPWLVKSV